MNFQVKYFILFLTLFSLLIVTSPQAEAANLYLSVPNSVQTGENFTIVAESVSSSPVNITLKISNRSSVPWTKEKEGDLAEFSVPGNTLSGGKYGVSAVAVNETKGVNQTSSSSLVVSEISSIRPIPLTSKNISSCPFSSLRGECKLLGFNATSAGQTNLKNLSVSGTVYNGSFEWNNTDYYFGIVDEDIKGQYDTVFLDDDPTFLENNETDSAENSFLGKYDSVFSIEEENARVIISYISKNKLVLTVPPTEEELPLNEGQNISYAVMTLADGSTAADFEVKTTLVNLKDGSSRDVTPAKPVTDQFGLSGIGTISDLGTGKYKLIFNNISTRTFEVKTFDIKYKIEDASTGKRKRNFKPGEKVEIQVYPVVGGSRMEDFTKSLTVIAPGTGTHELSGNTFTIPENESAGTATVQIEVTASETTQTASTSFDISKFKVHTVPLIETEDGYPEAADNFAPNSTGYLFVSAVNLGTSGDLGEIWEAGFYPIDNPGTGEDECSENVYDLKGSVGGSSYSLEILNFSNFTNSDLTSAIVEDVPEEFLDQCVVKFRTPSQTGFFNGEITVKRARKNDTETGNPNFGINRFKVRGESYAPSEWSREWTFGPQGRVAIKPRILRMKNYTQVNSSRITQVSFIGLEGPESGEPENISFVNYTENPNGPFLVFNAPDKAGHYRLRFRVQLNLSQDGGYETFTAAGVGHFSVQIFRIDGEVQGSYTKPPGQDVSLEIKVESPQGTAMSGVQVSPQSIYNWETDTEYINQTSVNTSGSTDENGTATIGLSPEGEWDEGYYRVKIKGKDSSGNVDYGYAFFHVEEYDTDMGMRINGEWEWNAVKGDNITFIPSVYDIGKKKEVTVEAINVNDSVLIYEGGRDSRVHEEIPITNLSWSVGEAGEAGGLGLNLSTADSISPINLSSGYYELNLMVELKTGDTVRAGEWFQLMPFDVTVEMAEDRETFGPGENVTFNVSFKENKTFWVKLGGLEGESEKTDEELNYNVTVTQDGPVNKSFTDKKWELFNVTVPDNAVEGWYDGQLRIGSGGSVTSEWFWFEVKTLRLGAPPSLEARFDQKLDNDTYLDDDDFDINYYPEWDLEENNCSELMSVIDDFDFNGSVAQETCVIAPPHGERLGSEYYGPKIYTLRINTTPVSLYISQDKEFNESGDLASGLSLYDSFEDPANVLWNVTDLGEEAQFEAVNSTKTWNCTDKLSGRNLDFAGNLNTFSNCYPLEKLAQGFTDVTYNALVTELGESSYTLYLSKNRTFNETGDLAVNVSGGENIGLDSQGINWTLEYVDDVKAELQAENGLASGIFLNQSTADYFLGDYQGVITFPEREEKYYEQETRDFNGDDDYNDTLYVIGEKNSGEVNAVRLSYDQNFTLSDSLRFTGPAQNGTVNGTGKQFYSGEFKESEWAEKEVSLYVPGLDGGGYYPWSVTKKPRNNHTFPVLLKKPSGTPISGADVRIDEMLKRRHTVTSVESSATAVSDSNGMAFLEVNLTDGNASTSDLGEYTIIPEANTSKTDGYKEMEQWEAPQVNVKVYGTDEEKYIGFGIQMEEYNNNTTVEVQNATGLVGLPPSQGGEYRVKTDVSETELGVNGSDADNDGKTNDTVHFVMWNESCGKEPGCNIEEPGLNVTHLAIDDDTNFAEDDETKTYDLYDYGGVDEFDRDELYANLTFLGEPSYSGGEPHLPYGEFAVFNDSSNNLSVYREKWEIPFAKNFSFGVQVTDLYNRSNAKEVNITINSIEFDGTTYNSSQTLKKETNSYGAALLKLAPEYFTGNSTWPEGEYIDVLGTISGAEGNQTFREDFLVSGEEEGGAIAVEGGGGGG